MGLNPKKDELTCIMCGEQLLEHSTVQAGECLSKCIGRTRELLDGVSKCWFAVTSAESVRRIQQEHAEVEVVVVPLSVFQDRLESVVRMNHDGGGVESSVESFVKTYYDMFDGQAIDDAAVQAVIGWGEREEDVTFTDGQAKKLAWWLQEKFG